MQLRWMLQNKGIITKEMEIVAKKEFKTPEEIRELVACGTVCIPANINHKSLSPEGIGSGLKTKIKCKPLVFLVTARITQWK